MGIWTYVGAAAVKAHWLIGLVYLIGSFFSAARLEHAISVPYRLWWTIWTWADDIVTGRVRG